MRITPLFAPLIAFVLSPAVHGIEVSWFTGHSCSGAAQQVYRNVRCNSCISPPGDYYAVRFSGLGGNNRVSIHNQNNCSPQSQVGQWYGNTCGEAPGPNTLRSAWVACPGAALDANNTTSAASNTTSAASNISYISYKGDANDTSVTGDANEANEANEANV